MSKKTETTTDTSTDIDVSQSNTQTTTQDSSQNKLGNQAVNSNSGTNASPPADDATLRQRASVLFSVVQAAYTDCDTKGKQWASTADRFGLCYKNAYDNHERVRKQQEAAEQLKADLCFAVLGLVVGGALSSLTTVAKNTNALKSATDWKVDGVTSVISGAIGKGVDSAKPTAKLPSVSTDPLTYYLDIRSHVSTHVANEAEYLNKYVQLVKDIQIGNQPLSLMENVDPQKIDGKLQAEKQKSKLFRSPGQINQESLTKELEVGLWASWVKTLRYKVTTQNAYRGTSNSYIQRDSAGGIVEQHLTNLTGEDFDFGWYTTDGEVDKMVNWGNKWSPSQTFSL
jgi:hypothetical protein